MRKLVVTALFVVLLPNVASAKNDYAIFTLGYGGALTRVADADAVAHAPRVGFTVYGGDWFLELDLAPVTFTNDARFFPAVLGGVEVGVHLPGERGNLAVTLIARSTEVGDAARGGVGLDGGVGVHFAFPAWGVVRFDPSLGAGISRLGGEPGYSGAWANAELDVITKIGRTLSIYVRAGADVRTYASRLDDQTFDARAVTLGAGIALHDLWGIGHNDP